MQDTQNQQTQQDDNMVPQSPMQSDPFAAVGMALGQDGQQPQYSQPIQDGQAVQAPQPIQNLQPVQPQGQTQYPATYSTTGQTSNPISYPAVDPASGQTIGQTTDQTTGQTTDQTQGPISVHTGTPESAPVPVAPEASSEDNVEYGYEKLRQIENAGIELEKIENKESLNQKPQDELQSEPQQPDPVALVPQVKPEGPKIFGYYIPPNITSNLSNIRAKKGTGDPQDARTWIYVLLDRLLKKQTYQQ